MKDNEGKERIGQGALLRGLLHSSFYLSLTLSPGKDWRKTLMKNTQKHDDKTGSIAKL